MLTALTVLPHLFFGLIAGVWVDRVPRRTLLILTDLGRTCVLATIPLLGITGMLRVEQLYAVAFMSGF